MSIGAWIVGLLVVVILVAIREAIRRRDLSDAVTFKLRRLRGFWPSKQVVGLDGHGIALDERREKLCLVTSTTAGIITRVISPREIVSAEIFEDGASVTRADRASQLGGAVVGGLALGGIGAVIGGLSGKTTTTRFATRVDLRIVVEDLSKPIHDIPLMHASDEAASSLLYSDAIRTARWWHGVLAVLMKRAANGADALAVGDVAEYAPSKADELKKLADLYSGGMLTPEEFTEHKAKLLKSAK
jgi:putative oligomerization/nucleic acid binding protein